ncbi:hypothetical protein EU527_17410 [Candidatus Thorarchaeota archaeon]|nr:MAG: hypothetical protein EU527_17410 [Candidatus Thorarchaeota archaeon]
MQLLITFKSFGPIRRHLGRQIIRLDVPEGSTVFQVIQKILELGDHSLRDIILDNGKISGNLIVILNKKDVSTLGGLDISVKEGDEVALLPHVQGG